MEEKTFKPVPDVECLKYHGTPEKPDIKIFVSHRIDLDSETIDNPLYIPVRCGAVYDERENVDMLGDDTGDNISEKRMSFCEYTVMYWAWKNIKADYYGLCHYRRYLSFSDKDIKGNALKQGLLDSMADINIQQCNLTDTDAMIEGIKTADAIVPYEYHMIRDWLPSSVCKTVREQWETYCASYLKAKHFDYLLELIEKHAPHMLSAAKSYMNGVHFRGFNCFVMKRELFNELCEFVFPILFEFDDTISKEHFSSTQKRAVGYAGEWLFSIFVHDIQQKKEFKVREKQIVAFQNTAKKYDLAPARHSNTIPLVFPLNDANRSLIAVTIQSILSHISPDNHYDFIFLQRSYDEDKWGVCLKKAENRIIQRMTAQYDNVSTYFYDPKDLIGKAEQHCFGKPSTEEQYYLLNLPWILKHYQKAIFIKETLLFTEDIAQLFEKDLNGKCIGVVRDPIFVSMLNGMVNGFYKKCKKVLNPENLYDYAASDLVLMNLEQIRQTMKQEDIWDTLDKQKCKNIECDGLNIIYEGKKAFISYEWANFECLDPQYFRMQEYLPDDIASELQTVQKPFGIVLRGTTGFSAPVQLEAGQLFWNYARKTPFYEQLVFQTIPNYSQNIFDLQCRVGLFDNRTGIRKFADKLLPHGSKRREFAKVLLPKGSLRWRFCKQIYYIFKPQYRPVKVKTDEDTED